MRLIAALLMSIGMLGVAYAQSIGGLQGIGLPLGGISAGGGGGGGGGACVLNLQLDASNACNLIGLMTGT